MITEFRKRFSAMFSLAMEIHKPISMFETCKAKGRGGLSELVLLVISGKINYW